MAMAYLTRWSGPVNETDDPYSDTLEYSPLGLPLQKHVQEVLVLPKRTGSLDNEVIKRRLWITELCSPQYAGIQWIFRTKMTPIGTQAQVLPIMQ
ncbi:hypothetical protein [Methanosarcina horonobensis]|uniref:hypothetical protein n=1 Tax=Methanosarcina horonobensis TaxID=418008 RepID=UPI0022B8A189|nr:hypothetical protein [Methanosarcina horonobensis]